MRTLYGEALIGTFVLAVPLLGQAPIAKAWEFSATADGYIVPHAEFFVSTTFAADRGKLHLEGRYNYEDQKTGSAWIGAKFSAGRAFMFEITPMVGGVFGNTTGVAPGYVLTLTYKRLEFYSTGEYVFDTKDRSASFFYSWPQLTYSPRDWVRVGLVAQHTKIYHTTLDTQRGVLGGFSYKKIDFTAYIFNPGWAEPTIVLEMGYSH
jgi:hypothetical protein